MKKYITILIIAFSFATAHSQEVFDALRLGQTGIFGTARFQAMSGAFGSLGGDLSAININPAGSAIFSNNQWSVSLNDNMIKNSTNYFGTKTESDKNSVNINQAGAVFVFDNYDNKSKWNKFSLSMNYEKTGNFENDVFSAGTNNNSIANYFLSYANADNGVPKSFITTEANETISDLYSFLGSNLPLNSAPDIKGFQAQQALLGFQGYIIENVISTASNDFYVSNVRAGGKYRQENSFQSQGNNGKLNFNAAAQYDNWLSLGLNLNSHFTDYKQSTSFFETNSNTLDANYRVKDIRFNNEIHTFGSGFSLQIGAIAKVNKVLRLGFTYDSPTWYELNDELTQSLTAVSTSTISVLSPDVVNPKVVNIYDPYTLKTPGKITLSGALIFAKNGLLSLDASTKDFSNSSFGPIRDFKRVNNLLTNDLKRTYDLKIGGEYRIKKLSLRGGFRTEQSPYINKKTMGDLYGISTGLGYNWGDVKLDASYAYSKRNLQNQFFYQGLTDYSSTYAINNNVTLTLTFDF
jgi:hypothetical protein